MLKKIKNRIEKELAVFLRDTDRLLSLSKISPILSKEIKAFALRKGKRLRPILFVIGYLGFSKRCPPRLYKSALSLELLHDFLIVHDDIIDKSDMRRGKPSVHKVMEGYFARHKNIKFKGEDLAIVVGDIMYAMATHAFLSIKEDEKRKEKALRKFLEAVIYTGCGEFIELISGTKDIKDITREDIYKIYDLKTAHYSFISPLSTGAILAGAPKNEVDKLIKYGRYLGRAFQIRDDILGIFGDERETGKSSATDLKEAKKTILVWHAYKNSLKRERRFIKKTLGKDDITGSDLSKMCKIITSSGALDYAKEEASRFLRKAEGLNSSSKMFPKYKALLASYSKKLLGDVSP